MTTARTIVLGAVIVLALVVAGAMVFLLLGLTAGVQVHSGGVNHIPIVNGQPAYSSPPFP